MQLPGNGGHDAHDAQAHGNEDDDEDDKYDDANYGGEMHNPQGQVMPPNLQHNDGRVFENHQENQVLELNLYLPEKRE